SDARARRAAARPANRATGGGTTDCARRASGAGPGLIVVAFGPIGRHRAPGPTDAGANRRAHRAAHRASDHAAGHGSARASRGLGFNVVMTRRVVLAGGSVVAVGSGVVAVGSRALRRIVCHVARPFPGCRACSATYGRARGHTYWPANRAYRPSGEGARGRSTLAAYLLTRASAFGGIGCPGARGSADSGSDGGP